MIRRYRLYRLRQAWMKELVELGRKADEGRWPNEWLANALKRANDRYERRRFELGAPVRPSFDPALLPDPDYACGSSYCDDPACNTHGPKGRDA